MVHMTKRRSGWVDVDLDGLAKILARRGKWFAIYELVQNAWDEPITAVHVTLEDRGRGLAFLKVEDDSPTGFADLSHAYTLYGESTKKSNPTQRGVFDVGEKYVLALCEEATVRTTTGTVHFNRDGTRRRSAEKRPSGSVFEASIRMTREEQVECAEKVRLLIPPHAPRRVDTFFNGEKIPLRVAIRSAEDSLPTVLADQDGNLRRTIRSTTIHIYEPKKGETPMLYEMGIPIVETDDRWHVSIEQKVPLNVDRDNVTPAFLRQVRTIVLNAMAKDLTQEEAAETWVREAAGDPRITQEAFATVLDKRVGEKRAVFDPHDPESNALAVAKGYTIMHGGTLTSEEWTNNKRFNATLPTSTLTPSPKLELSLFGGKNIKPVERSAWTPAMAAFERFAIIMAREVLHRNLTVKIVNDVSLGALAAYGGGELILNLMRLGHAFFEAGPGEKQFSLLIHEFAHDKSTNHLEEDYHDALSMIGGRMTRVAIDKPELFK